MVAAIGLPALGGVIAVLFLLAFAGPLLPPRALAPATAALCAMAGLLAGLTLLSGERALAAQGLLAIDGLGAWFALAPALAGFAACCMAIDGRASPWLPATVAAGLLVTLSGTATIALLAAALYAAGAPDQGLPRGRAVAAAGLFLLAGSLAMLAIGGTAFAAMRGAPLEGWRMAPVLLAATAGAACLWSARQDFPATPAIGLYLLARVLLDLCGPATPAWWGVPLLLAGGALAVLGAVRSTRAASFGGVLAAQSLLHAGWMCAGLGAAAVARAADLLPLAALAAGGALLHALGYTLVASLAAMSAAAAEAAAGSRAMDRLGGLARRMRVTSAAMLVAGLGLGLLPPGVGFASAWMVLQALFAAPRIGGLPMQLLLTATVLALAAAAGLGAAGLVRMAGVAFLGRPRTPRASAAEDPGRAQRVAMLGMATLCGAAGLFPGLLLRLAGPALRVVSGAGADSQGGWAGLQTQLEAAIYGPLQLALLVLALLTGLALLVRTGRLRAAVAVPAWEDGFAAPPAWMPFGDPATQADSSSLAAGWSSLPRVRLHLLPLVRLKFEVRWPPPQPGHAAAAILIGAVLLLVAVAIGTPG